MNELEVGMIGICDSENNKASSKSGKEDRKEKGIHEKVYFMAVMARASIPKPRSPTFVHFA